MNQRAVERYMNKLLAERASLKSRIERIDQTIESCKIIANGISNPDLNRFADALYDIALDIIKDNNATTS